MKIFYGSVPDRILIITSKLYSLGITKRNKKHIPIKTRKPSK